MIILKQAKNILIGLTVILVSLFQSSCDNAKMDRKDKVAAIVGELQDPFLSATFTPQVLMDKSGVKEGALPFTYEAFATFFLSEKKTGIDNDGQVQIVVENSGGMVPNGYVFIPLVNASQFRTLVEKELSAKVQEKNGAQYFRKDDDNYVVAWKDDLAILTNIPLSLDNLFSKGTNESKKAAIHLVNLLNEVSKKNIHEEFRQFFDKEGDVLIHGNGQTAYKLIDGMRFVSKKEKAQLKSLLDGTILETSLNFDQGSISFKGNYTLADSLKSYFNILKSTGVDASMLNYGWSSNPTMTFSLNMSPKHFVKLLKAQREMMDTEDLEDVLSEVDVKLDDLDKMFTGEIVVMVDGVDSTERTYTNYSGEETVYKSLSPKSAIVIGLKDPVRIQQAIDKMQPGVAVQKIDGMWYHIQNEKLFLTKSEDWLAKIKSNQTILIDANAHTKNAFGFYLNPKMATDIGMDLDDMDHLKEEFSSIMAEVKETGTEITIKLNEINKNALRVILEKVVEEFENQEKKNNSGMEALLNDELMETIETEVGASVEEIVNSKEMKDLQGILEKL
ncbi:MAG: hypothetical protein AB8B74_14585 [Crocinitomicaceae bacterium]